MSISAAQVKELRDRTGAGMMDCKKALAETSGDLEAAVDILKKKGLATAEKRKGRAIKEGLIRIHVEGNTAGMVEVNCETDFVARNEEFEALASGLAKAVVSAKPATIDQVRALSIEGTSAQDCLTNLIGKIGENMAITRHALVKLEGPGLIETYLHAGGKVGVIIALGTAVADKPEAREIAHELALHVAFANPAGLDRDAVPAEVIERERRISRERALEQGKPENIVDKIVDGQINKYYGEIVLLEQTFVKDDKMTVKGWLEQQGKALGATPEVKAFARFALGEATDDEVEG